MNKYLKWVGVVGAILSGLGAFGVSFTSMGTWVAPVVGVASIIGGALLVMEK